jgi:hypothetical protein
MRIETTNDPLLVTITGDSVTLAMGQDSYGDVNIDELIIRLTVARNAHKFGVGTDDLRVSDAGYIYQFYKDTDDEEVAICLYTPLMTSRDHAGAVYPASHKEYLQKWVQHGE